jgi:endonuclease YncB( thermonuclease family)
MKKHRFRTEPEEVPFHMYPIYKPIESNVFGQQPLHLAMKNKRIALTAWLLLVFTLPAAAQQRVITGRVIGLADGDTLTLFDGKNKQHKIRLDGIDAPESSQPFGARSKQSLSSMVFGKTITVTSSKTDRYGRLVGKVTIEGKNINYVQVLNGWAWFYRDYARELSAEDASDYEQAEKTARSQRRGLWTDPSPAPPWEYRKGKREATAKVEPPANGRIIGNRSSRVYHRPDCPAYNDVGERNRVVFKTAAEAERAGFRLAGNCPRTPGS